MILNDLESLKAKVFHNSTFSILDLEAAGFFFFHSERSQILVIQIHLLSQHIILNHLDPSFLVLMYSIICFLIIIHYPFCQLNPYIIELIMLSKVISHLHVPIPCLQTIAFIFESGKSILGFDCLLKLSSYMWEMLVQI